MYVVVPYSSNLGSEHTSIPYRIVYYYIYPLAEPCYLLRAIDYIEKKKRILYAQRTVKNGKNGEIFFKFLRSLIQRRKTT